MLTIPEIDEIAKRATERIAKEFAESGFPNPPVVTHGIVRAVLEAAAHPASAARKPLGSNMQKKIPPYNWIVANGLTRSSIDFVCAGYEYSKTHDKWSHLDVQAHLTKSAVEV